MATSKKAKTAAKRAAKNAPQVDRTRSAPQKPEDAAPDSQEREDTKRDDVAEDSSPVEYQPTHQPLEHAGFDHQAAEEQRQAELSAQRDEHNERVAHGRGFKFN